MRRLEISSLESVRIFFQAMVASQLFGRELVYFSEKKFEDLQVRFLKSTFNLPQGFPKVIGTMLLGLPPLPWQQLRSFQNMAARVIEPVKYSTRETVNPVKFALAIDRKLLRSATESWNLEMCAIVGDYADDDDLIALSPLTAFDTHGDLILRKARNQRVNRVESLTGSSFSLAIFPEAVASPNFRRSLGQLPHEGARMVILFFGDMWRWSVLEHPRRKCDCSVSLHVRHFFECPTRVVHLQRSWDDLLRMGRTGEWLDLFRLLCECLRVWNRTLKIKESVLAVIN